MLSALLLALAVIIGAFGAHALSALLDDRGRELFRTASIYHLVHALGIMIVVLIPQEIVSKSIRSKVCCLLFVGVLLFSGSLYLLAVYRFKYLGVITPLGGLGFIIAWLLLAWGVFNCSIKGDS